MSGALLSVHLDPALQARLNAEAAAQNRSADALAQKAIGDYLGRKDAFRAMIREAAIDAEGEEFISSEAMHAWMASWDTENELPPPEPDVFIPRVKV